MKRYLLLLAFICMAFFVNSAPVTIYPGLTLEQYNGTYHIHFEMPKYDIVTDTFSVINTTPLPMNQYGHAPGDYYFSRVQPVEDDYFDYLSVDGRPELPFYALNLLMPSDGGDYYISSVHVLDSDTYVLPYDYTPSQAENYTFEDFSQDPNYYGSYNHTWYWNHCATDTIWYRQTKGLTFSIFPCHYEPSQNNLTVVTEAEFEITYNGSPLTESYLENQLISDRSVYYFYDNYVGFSAPYPQINDEYLIITADIWKNSTELADFIHHKELLGYNVTMVSLSDIGYTADDIRAYIKYAFENDNVKFVLLVGNVEDLYSLDFSGGSATNPTDPPTDIYYSCLSKNNNDQWKDYSPSVFVGRWPIQNTTQLRNIVDKTIASDLYLGSNNPNEINIFTGNGHHKNYTLHSLKYIYNNVVQKYSYYTGCLIDGRYINSSDAIDSLKSHLEDDNDNPTWMFIYGGHGAYDKLEGPYNFGESDITHLLTSSLDFQPFGFGFTSSTGNIYPGNNFARTWITDTEGGITYLGSTTISYATPDRYFSRKMFNQLKNQPNITIGEFISNAKANYYNPDKVIWRRREVEKYVLYGDPSLYLFGINFHYNQPYSVSHRYQNPDSIDNITTVRVYSITGQLLRVNNAPEPDLRGLPTGTYMVVCSNNENNQITQKIVLQ